MPRVPSEAWGRSVSSGSGGSARSARTWFNAAARSGAVSASVPSRSNSTARTGSSRGLASEVTAERRNVVDRRIGLETISLGDRVVGHADERVGLEAGAPRESGQLRRLEEASVVVRALRKEPEQVFPADHREQIGLGIAIDGREHDEA